MKNGISLTLSAVFFASCFGVTAVDAQPAAKTVPGPQNSNSAFVSPYSKPATGSMRGDGPPPAADPFSITRLDPALDQIIAPDAKPIPIGNQFGLGEGPVWVPDKKGGYLLISDMLSNVVYKIAPDNKVSVFIENAGYSGNDIQNAGFQTRRGRMHVLLIGPECTSRDSQGRLVWCASNDGTIMRLEKDGTRTVVASGYQGKRFDGPNDLAMMADDTIFFTDVDTGLRFGAKSPLKQLPNAAVYRIKDGQVSVAIDDATLGGYPNGIAISPDDKYIYLSSARRAIMRYEIKPDGSLANGIDFYEELGIGDGMKTDVKGNLFAAGGGGRGEISIISPTGKKLGLINMPADGNEPKRQICATNEAWGEAGGHTMFIAACEMAYKIHMRTAGRIPGPPAE